MVFKSSVFITIMLSIIQGIMESNKSNYLLESLDWSSLVVGKISPWIELDSINEVVRKNSEQVQNTSISGLY